MGVISNYIVISICCQLPSEWAIIKFLDFSFDLDAFVKTFSFNIQPVFLKTPKQKPSCSQTTETLESNTFVLFNANFTG